MKATIAAIAALAGAVSALPAEKLSQASACASAVTLSGNPFATRTLHPNSFYRKEVEAAAAAISDATLKAQALKVADVGSFLWMYVFRPANNVEE